MKAFVGRGIQTEAWDDTLQSGQPAIRLPGSPPHPAGTAASTSEFCPAPHRPLVTFPAIVVLLTLYWLSGNTHTLIWAEDCERSPNFFLNYYYYFFPQADLVVCEEQQKWADSHREFTSSESATGPVISKLGQCVCKKAAGSKQESGAGEMTAVRVQPLPAPSFWPLPKQKQYLNLSKHPQWQRGRVRLITVLFTNIQLTQHPSLKEADAVFSTDRYIYIILINHLHNINK